MKRILFALMLGLGACTGGNKEPNIVTDTIMVNKKVDTIIQDTVSVTPMTEKSLDQKADDRLDEIMKNRKTLK